MGVHRKKFHVYMNVKLYCTLIYVCILNIITRIRVCYLYCTLTRIRVCYLYCTLMYVCILNIITRKTACYL